MGGFTAQDPDFAVRVWESFDRQGFMRHLGAAMTRLEPGLCEIEVPYRPDLTQQHGFFHAGVISSIADTAAGYAAYSLMPADASVLTIEFKINLMSPGRGERIVARALVDRPGQMITVVTAEVYALTGADEKRIAKLTASMMCLPGRSDRPGP